MLEALIHNHTFPAVLDQAKFHGKHDGNIIAQGREDGNIYKYKEQWDEMIMFIDVRQRERNHQGKPHLIITDLWCQVILNGSLFKLVRNLHKNALNHGKKMKIGWIHTSRGTSALILSSTRLVSPVLLVKLTRYLSEKLSE